MFVVCFCFCLFVCLPLLFSFFIFVCLFVVFCFLFLFVVGKWACLDVWIHLGTAGILYSVTALLTTSWVSFVLVVVVIGSNLVTVPNSKSNRLQQTDKAV